MGTRISRSAVKSWKHERYRDVPPRFKSEIPSFQGLTSGCARVCQVASGRDVARGFAETQWYAGEVHRCARDSVLSSAVCCNGPRPQARRAIRFVVICFLIGLTINVLVAWGFAAWGKTTRQTGVVTFPLPTSVGGLQQVASLTWSIDVTQVPAHPSMRIEYQGIGVRVREDLGVRPLNTPFASDFECRASPTTTLLHARFGWPLPAMQWHDLKESDRPRGSHSEGSWLDLSGAGPVPSAGAEIPRRLPLEPLWWGLVGNTVILLSVAVVPAWLAAAARPLRRRRRGLCPACAYDLLGDHSAGCPECGWNQPVNVSTPVCR